MTTTQQPTARQIRALDSLINELFECNESRMAYSMLRDLKAGINRDEATSLIQIADHLLRRGSHEYA